VISHQHAKRLANEHLRAKRSPLVAYGATRDRQYDVWVVGYRDPERLEVMLVGGALVVTDEGDVHEVGSAPDALDLLMLRIGR
jgi:hypothetical protein